MRMDINMAFIRFHSDFCSCSKCREKYNKLNPVKEKIVIVTVEKNIDPDVLKNSSPCSDFSNVTSEQWTEFMNRTDG